MGFRFGDHPLAFFWDEIAAEIGAGGFCDQFLYLFGTPVLELNRCLAHWSFLLPQPEKERWVIGRNAYGALLVLEEPSRLAHGATVGILDPLNVAYHQYPDRDLVNLLGYYLPEKCLEHFFDEALYRAWHSVTGGTLEWDAVLAARVPIPLGGSMAIENFDIEDIFQYYESTAAIYRDLQIGRG